VAGCAAAVVVGSSCTWPGFPRRTTTTTRPPQSGDTLDTVNYKAQAAAGKAAGTLPWFCHSEGLGGNMDHGTTGEAGLANDWYKGKVKGDLSWDDCTKLADQFDQIIAKVKPYKTRGDAKKAGSGQAVQFVPGLGTHDMVAALRATGLPPGAPTFLQYDGESDSAPLAGMSWLTITSGQPPEGFPGGNDWWHTHTTLCYRAPGPGESGPQVVGNEISDADCAAKGGRNGRLPGAFMSHAWIVPGYEDRFDVFSGAYMCLKGTGTPPAPTDPCHDDHSDPEHGGNGTHDMGSMTTTTRSTGGVTTTTRSTGVTTATTMPPMDHTH
jgi:hypothetical protein